MEWFTNVIVPLLIAIVPAVIALTGTLIGVKTQLKQSEKSAEKHRNEIEAQRELKDEERQRKQEEVLRCLLRTELLNMYFKHIDRDNRELTQWESENMHKMADAYAGLDGNSFVKPLVEKMTSWDVVKN